MSTEPQYNIRDKTGNVYGPADAATLVQWTQQGRIVAGMSIAPDGTEAWVEASTHPAVAHLFGNVPMQATGAVSETGGNPYAESTAYRPTPQYQTPGDYAGMPKLNILGLLSMIAGILSIPTFCCCGVFGIAGVIMGVISLVQFSKSPERYTGKALAWVGVITGGVGILISLVYWIAAILMSNTP